MRTTLRLCLLVLVFVGVCGCLYSTGRRRGTNIGVPKDQGGPWTQGEPGGGSPAIVDNEPR